MGSWNETCWLSNLPITAGSHFYLVLLKENHGYGSERTRGFVHNHAVWAPFALPIPGSYNDYGGLEGWDATDPSLEVLRVYLRENVITYPMGNNPCHDLPVTQEMFDEPDWIEQIQQRMSHGMGIQVNEHKKPRLGAVFIRGDVYDALAERTFTTWKDDEVNIQSRMDEIAKYAKCLVDVKVTEEAYFSALKNKVDEKERVLLSSANFNAREELERMWMMPREWCPRWVLNNQILLEDESVRRRLAAFLQVADAAEGLRKLWHPTCGSGSQGGDWGLYMDFAKLIHEGAQKSKRRFLDDDSDSEWGRKFYGGFWKRFPPAKILEYNERCTTDDIKDLNGDPVPGIGDFGDPGESYNYETKESYPCHRVCLFVVEEARAGTFWYVLYDDSKDEWLEIEHPVGPHRGLVRYMEELPLPEAL